MAEQQLFTIFDAWRFCEAFYFEGAGNFLKIKVVKTYSSQLRFDRIIIKSFYVLLWVTVWYVTVHDDDDEIAMGGELLILMSSTHRPIIWSL